MGQRRAPLNRRHCRRQMQKGRICRLFQAALGRRRGGQAKDQPEQARMAEGKVEIAHARPQKPLIGCLQPGRLPRLHAGQKAVKPPFRQRLDHAGRIAEMMGRGAVADAHPRGHPPQGKPRQTAFGQLGLTGIENRAAQVAVVIA